MMLALTAIFAPLTTIATVLRFVAKSQTKAVLGFDYHFAVLSLLTFCIFTGFAFWGKL